MANKQTVEEYQESIRKAKENKSEKMNYTEMLTYLTGQEFTPVDVYSPKDRQRRIQIYKQDRQNRRNSIDVSKSLSPLDRAYAPVRYIGDMSYQDIMDAKKFSKLYDKEYKKRNGTSSSATSNTNKITSTNPIVNNNINNQLNATNSQQNKTSNGNTDPLGKLVVKFATGKDIGKDNFTQEDMNKLNKVYNLLDIQSKTGNKTLEVADKVIPQPVKDAYYGAEKSVMKTANPLEVGIFGRGEDGLTNLERHMQENDNKIDNRVLSFLGEQGTDMLTYSALLGGLGITGKIAKPLGKVAGAGATKLGANQLASNLASSFVTNATEDAILTGARNIPDVVKGYKSIEDAGKEVATESLIGGAFGMGMEGIVSPLAKKGFNLAKSKIKPDLDTPKINNNIPKTDNDIPKVDDNIPKTVAEQVNDIPVDNRPNSIKIQEKVIEINKIYNDRATELTYELAEQGYSAEDIKKIIDIELKDLENELNIWEANYKEAVYNEMYDIVGDQNNLLPEPDANSPLTTEDILKNNRAGDVVYTGGDSVNPTSNIPNRKTSDGIYNSSQHPLLLGEPKNNDILNNGRGLDYFLNGKINETAPIKAPEQSFPTARLNNEIDAKNPFEDINNSVSALKNAPFTNSQITSSNPLIKNLQNTKVDNTKVNNEVAKTPANKINANEMMDELENMALKQDSDITKGQLELLAKQSKKLSTKKASPEITSNNPLVKASKKSKKKTEIIEPTTKAPEVEQTSNSKVSADNYKQKLNEISGARTRLEFEVAHKEAEYEDLFTAGKIDEATYKKKVDTLRSFADKKFAELNKIENSIRGKYNIPKTDYDSIYDEMAMTTLDDNSFKKKDIFGEDTLTNDGSRRFTVEEILEQRTKKNNSQSSSVELNQNKGSLVNDGSRRFTIEEILEQRARNSNIEGTSNTSKVKEVPPKNEPPVNGQEVEKEKRISDKVKFTEKETTSILDKAKTWYTRLVDNKDPIKKNASKTTYQKAINSSYAEGIISNMLDRELSTRDGKKLGKSVKELFSDIPKEKYDDFIEFLYQRHNIDRAKVEKNVDFRFDAKESAEIVENLKAKNPEFEDKANEIVKWIDDFTAEWGVNAGLIDTKTYNNFREMYPNYIPTNRIFGDNDIRNPFGSFSEKYVDVSSPFKRATGSNKDIVHPVESIIMMVDRMVKTAKYNEVGLSFLNDVETGKLGDVAKVIEGDIPTNRNNIVTVIRDGKKVGIEINDMELVKSLQNINKNVDGNIGKVVRKYTNLFKSLITEDNPIFAILNGIRDTADYSMNTIAKNPIKSTGNLLSSYGELIGDSLFELSGGRVGKGAREDLAQFRRLGGGSSNFSARNNSSKIAKEIVEGKKSNLSNFTPRSLVHRFNNIIETAPRLAEFKNTKQSGGTLEQGMFNAGDVTTNFSRHGDITKEADAFVPFLNPNVQGLDKFARQLKNHPLQTTARGLGYLTAPSLLEYAINKDDEEYQQISNDMKDAYYHLPDVFDLNEDGKFIRLPKSRSYGALFSSIPQRIARAVDGDQKAFDGIVGMLNDSYGINDPLKDNIFSTYYNLKSNEDAFGRPIVSQSLERLEPRYQYDERTSEIGKFVGDIFNISPKKIDYAIDNTTGIYGDMLLPATTRSKGVLDAIKKVTTNRFITDSLYSNQPTTDFYNNANEISTKYNTNNFLENNNMEFDKREQQAIKEFNSQFTNLKEEIADLNNELSRETDEEKIRKLKARMIEKIKRLNNVYENYKSKK